MKKRKNNSAKNRITQHLIAVRLSNLRRALYKLKEVFRGHDKDILESFATTIDNSIYTMEHIMLKKEE